MKSRACFLFAVCAVLLYTCAVATGSRTSAPYQDAPKIEVNKRLAPLAIAGSQLHYRDNHDRYVYTFISDGRYRFASVHQSRTWADSREGHRPRSRGLTAKEHQT
jgi:hypothetical protein